MTEEPIITEGEITSDDKLCAALGYPIGIIAIVMLLMEDKKARPFIKFHSVQSIAVGIVFIVVVPIVAVFTLGCGGLIWLIMFWWAYKAYQGESFEIPVVTNFIKGQGWV